MLNDTVHEPQTDFKYMHVAVLCMCILIGGPINVYVFVKLRRRDTENSIHLPASLKLLQKHLNISDLMVLFIHVPFEINKSLMSPFKGGDVVCRLLKFHDVLCFQLSCNIIVAIAVDRLLRQDSNTNKLTTVILVMISWAVATILATPMLLIYETVFYASQNITMCSGCICHDARYAEMCSTYFVIHIITQFWLPLVLLLICYCILMCRIFHERTCCFQSFTKRLMEDVAFEQSVTILRSGSRLKTSMLIRKRESDILKRLHQAKHDQPNSSAAYGSIVVTYDSLRAPPLPVLLDGRQIRKQNNCHQGHCEIEMREQVNGELRRSTVQSLREIAVVEQSFTPPHFYQAQRRALRLTTVLVVTFVICWLPYHIVTVLPNHAYFGFAQHLIVVNSVLNPFLYGLGLQCHKARILSWVC